MLRPLVVGACLLAGLLAASGCARAQGDQDIDWNRARVLHQRLMRGEKLTPEEQAYHDRAARILASRNRAGGAPLTPKETTGLPPLTDLKAGAYKGETGGLYGEGRNEPPPAHLKLATREAAQVRPLDAEGRPSPSGKVVLLAIGMSNTTQEFSRFKQVADADSRKSPSLVIVDGAQGGQAADQWLDDAHGQQVWAVAEQRLRAAGVTPAQVQVVWIKQALVHEGRFGQFPAHAKHLQASLEKIVELAKQRFPNLRLAYLSSRIYGGYATTQLNPEPYAYEGAYAVRWAIQDQMKGDPKLNADPARGVVKAPVMLWGPYLWADGVKGRKLDSLVWTREDLGPDGTHPSASGRQKVADLLLRFFTTDPTARPWFVKGTGVARR